MLYSTPCAGPIKAKKSVAPKVMLSSRGAAYGQVAGAEGDLGDPQIIDQLGAAA